MLSEGRSQRRHSWALLAFMVGLVYLAMVGSFVTVRAVVGWLT